MHRLNISEIIVLPDITFHLMDVDIMAGTMGYTAPEVYSDDGYR